MTSEQYEALLRELAQVAGLDSAGLLDHGRIMIGEASALLAHDPQYEEDLLQVRMVLGGAPQQDQGLIARALLQANYVSGYGGECVFSLQPQTGEVVMTMRMRLHAALSAQELWQELSDIAAHGTGMWKAITAPDPVAQDAPPSVFAAHAQHRESIF